MQTSRRKKFRRKSGSWGRKRIEEKKEEIEKERRGRERGNPFKSGSKSG